MATVYSYICWGGRLGKSVTVNASTDYVTLTDHGLRDGKGVAFTSGTLPSVSGTALALNTVYYAKKISTSTFELYYDAALTSKIDFTSAGSSLVLKGAHFLALADKSRYGPSGSERIYGGLMAFLSGRANASPSDFEVCEIGEAFYDTLSANGVIALPAAAVTITTTVKGVYGEAYHAGIVGAGYVVRRIEGYGYSGLSLSCYNAIVDGFTVLAVENSTSGLIGVTLARPSCIASRMIAIGPGVQRGMGFSTGNPYVHFISCLALGFGKGFNAPQYQNGPMYKSCTAVKNAIGFGANATSQIYGLYFNNISVGNTTNWSAVTGFERAAYNAGESGDSPWVTSTNPTITMATTDFVDFANNDFRPASSTSPQVETGMFIFGAEFDVANNVRPAYVGANYGSTINAGSFVPGLAYTIASIGTTDFTAIGATANTVGLTFKATGAGSGDGTAVLTAVFDVGCYEFDQGYGAWPVTATLTLTGLSTGSDVVVREAGTGNILDSVDQVSGSTWGYTYTELGNVDIDVIKPGMVIVTFRNLALTAESSSLPVSQQPDRNYQ